MRETRQPHAVTQQLSASFYFILFFFGDFSFSEYFCAITVFSWHGECVVRFPLSGVFFYIVTTDWIFYIISLCNNSINQLNRHTLSGQSRVYRVTQLRTDGVHCRESAGTGPVVLKVVPVTGAAFASLWTNYCAYLFFQIHYWYEVGMLKLLGVLSAFLQYVWAHIWQENGSAG